MHRRYTIDATILKYHTGCHRLSASKGGLHCVPYTRNALDYTRRHCITVAGPDN